MEEFSVEFYDNQDFILKRYVIFEEDINKALELAKNEAYHLINEGSCVPFTVSVLNKHTQLVYYTMTKKLEKWY